MPGFTGENFMLQSLDDEPVQRERMVDGKPYIELVWNGALSAVKEGTFPLEVEMDVELLVPQKRQRRTNPFGSPFMNDPIFDNYMDFYKSIFMLKIQKIKTPKVTNDNFIVIG